jgi:hypothetical protein
MGVIHHALHSGKPYDKILKAMSYGFCFAAKGEEGTIFTSDITFLDELSRDFESALIRDLNFDPASDKFLIEELKDLYRELKA